MSPRTHRILRLLAVSAITFAWLYPHG